MALGQENQVLGQLLHRGLLTGLPVVWPQTGTSPFRFKASTLQVGINELEAAAAAATLHPGQKLQKAAPAQAHCLILRREGSLHTLRHSAQAKHGTSLLAE